MNTDRLLTRARKFWRVAAMVPPTLELQHPERVKALEYGRWKDKRVLDYGCGGGSDVLSYLRRGAHVTAADIVPSNLATTEMRVRDDERSLDFHEKIASVLVDDPMHLPHGREAQGLTSYAGTFDAAQAYHVLHHVPFDLAVKIAREVGRTLVAGGWLYVTLYTHRVEVEYAFAAQDRAKRHHIELEEALAWMTDGEGCPYVEVYNERKATDLLDAAGFEVRSSYEFKDGWSRTYRCQKR